ncbi:MAG: type II secretion system GspH family protein [Planctomycetes bacterium]|nr:type II secretion system GspH family protein [Planctomycetota bacterium]
MLSKSGTVKRGSWGGRSTRPTGARTHGRSEPVRFGMRTAFTLLEALVVIAIISVLAGLLLPQLARGRAQAKAAVCLSRLKEIGNSTAVYSTANTEQLPPAQIDWHPTLSGSP